MDAVSVGTAILTAFLAKLLFGADDALLLTTYFCRPDATFAYQVRMASIYVLMMNVVVFLAVGAALLMHFALSHFSDDDAVSYWTSIACGALLVAYALYLRFADDDDDDGGGGGDAEKGGDDKAALLRPDESRGYGAAAGDTDAQQRYANPYVVFFLTGLDDAIVYLILVLHDSASWYAILFGAGIGTLFLTAAGYFVSTVRVLIDFVQMIPQYAIVLFLAALILVGTVFDVPYL